jgi:hypothetical protein
MAKLTNYDLAKIVGDLLTIAKVGMPEHLHGEDRRLRAAQELLTSLGASQHRVPAMLDVDAEQPPFLGSADPADPIARQVAAALDAISSPDPDVAAALDTYLAEQPIAPTTKAAAIDHILRDWLTGHGYLEHRRAADPFH